MNSQKVSQTNQPAKALPYDSPDITRRKFLATTGAAALGATILKPQLVRGAEANSKINLGVIGCGGRGSWIADLFGKNGNYNMVRLLTGPR